MLDLKKLHQIFDTLGIRFYTGVPDSLLNDFCLYLSENIPDERHVIAANEGNAIAIAAGYHLATGSVPLVYMQNSGIGNSLNPLISLTNIQTYAIPLILLIGWRGSPGVKDWAHHKEQGRNTTRFLESLNITYQVLENFEEETYDSVKWAIENAKEQSSPVALLVKKGVLAKDEKRDFMSEESKYKISREKAIECIINNVPCDSIFIATTGRATREIYEVRKKRDESHALDFLNVGAMGHASSIALGLSMGKRDRLIVCLDGDASAIMHLGALAIIGTSGRSNILHIILNNGSHESVGGQPSVGHKINFTKIAESVGYKTIGCEVDSTEDLKTAVGALSNSSVPAFIDIRIRKGIRHDVPPLDLSLIKIKDQLMDSIKRDFKK